MFRGPVTETKFYGGVAENVFRNIAGDSYRGDVSFISTVRALVSSRAHGDEITVRFCSSEYEAETIVCV